MCIVLNSALQFNYLKKSGLLWHAECIITKTYKLTQFTNKFGSRLNKPYCNEKLLSAAGQIVS